MKITCEDNMKLMARYEDNYFDLAIVDPPYAINRGGQKETFTKQKKHKRKYHKQKEWDNAIPNKEYFIELQRVSKNQIVWGGNYFTDFLKESRGWIYWDKNNGDNNFSDGELGWTSFKKRLMSYCINSKAGTRGGRDRFHPTQKPVKLYEWLLMNYAKEGDKILDTHLGSGSIALACHNLGYDLTGYELDKEYYDNAIKRIKNHQAQTRIF